VTKIVVDANCLAWDWGGIPKYVDRIVRELAHDETLDIELLANASGPFSEIEGVRQRWRRIRGGAAVARDRLEHEGEHEQDHRAEREPAQVGRREREAARLRRRPRRSRSRRREGEESGQYGCHQLKHHVSPDHPDRCGIGDCGVLDTCSHSAFRPAGPPPQAARRHVMFKTLGAPESGRVEHPGSLPDRDVARRLRP
jgi:hypothetical protein